MVPIILCWQPDTHRHLTQYDWNSSKRIMLASRQPKTHEKHSMLQV